MLGRNKQRKSAQIDTLVGRNTRVSGDVEFNGGFHIDGYIKGNLQSEADSPSVLSISESGTVEGSVCVPHVVLNGTVKGDVSARERIELGATARVIGNVYYNLIEMAIGAEVNGKLIHEPPGQPALITQASAAIEVDVEDGDDLVQVGGK